MPTLAEWIHISAIGGAIITGATLVASLYLLVILYRQGRGKLRVRLLLGMVISDLLLGVVIFPSEVASLANRPIRTGTTVCNVQGFFFTAALMQQHLWTFSIAVATFLLLKYPLSNKTTFLERYSWICAPLIWGISFLHSGLWWIFAGWVSNGNLCYYQNTSTATGVGASDLIQFIPRAFVFISIFIIYCTLFKFLRRPDTIQLSSQFVAGLAQSPGHSKRKLGFKQTPKPVDPAAPWEALEFVQVGGKKQRGFMSPTASRALQSPIESQHSATFTSPMSDHEMPMPLPIPEGDEKHDDYSLHSLEPSRRSSKHPELLTPSTGDLPVLSVLHHDEHLSPIISGGEVTSPKLPHTPLEQQNQTLQEFFQEYDPENAEKTDASENRRVGGPNMSATAYFNRQASLLMLYFPLAYLVVFSLSIARLIYNMASSTPNQLLTLLSGWFVLSVGFVDALVYGLAEFLVRRRVRKVMPDRMG